MFKSLKLRKQVTALVTLVSMVLNIFSPAIVALSRPVSVYAQDNSLNLSFNPTTHMLSLGSSFSYSLYYQTGETIEAVTGSNNSVFLGSASTEGSRPHSLVRGILKLSDQAVYFVKNHNSIVTVASVPSSNSGLSGAEESWLNDPSTYGDLKTGVTYHAPFNPDFSLVFEILPDNPGTITFGQLSLTDEQMEVSGSLSRNAYELTSTMTDGTFTYTLSLPNPVSQENVGIKYSEDGNSFSPVDQVSQTSGQVTATSLDHFTIFVISTIQDNPQVRINEFVYNPSTGSEWIELYNGESHSVDLTNWRLTDAGFHSLVLTGSISAHGYKVVSTNWLNNTGSNGSTETITLSYPTLNIVDRLRYFRCDGWLCLIGDPVSSDNTMQGKSIGRSTDGGSDWTSFAVPTPGYTNLGDSTAPEISYSLSAEPNAVGWHKNDVTVTWTVTDLESPITSPACNPQIVSIEGETLATCTAVSGGGTSSSSVTIKLDKTPPSTPHLTWPIDDTYTNDNTPLMQWDDSTMDNSGIAGYLYRVYYRCSNPSDFSTCTHIYPSSLGLWLTASQYQAGTTADGVYYWQVRSQDNAGNQSDWSDAEKVTIDTVAPTATYTHYVDGAQFTGSIAYVNSISKLTFTGEYQDAMPSSGLLKDSYVIFDAQDDGSFRFSQNGARGYCGWRTEPNLVALSGNAFSFTDQESFSNCVADLPNGEYYMAHQVYDNAIRKDIPSITQFRDVLGLHFVIDKNVPTGTISYDIPTLTNTDVIATLSTNEPVTITSASSSTTHTFTANGTFTFTFVDSAGNVGSAVATVDWIDKTVPTVDYSEHNPSDRLLTNKSTQVFGATTSEPASSCTLNFNGNYVERIMGSEISDGSGMSYVISGDDSATNYVLPFAFPFYGNNYSNVSVSTNGLLRFASSPDNSLGDSVSGLISRVAIAPLWDDIVTTVSALSTADQLLLRWTGHGWASGGSLVAETLLRSNGAIELRYGSVNLPSRNPTIGLSSGNGTDYIISSVSGSSAFGPVSFTYSAGPSQTYPMVSEDKLNWEVEVAGIADGQINYSVSCTDLATNVGESSSRSLIVDTKSPVLSSKTTYENWYSEDQLSEFFYTDENGIKSGNPASCMITSEGENQTCTVTPEVIDNADNHNQVPVISNGANIDKFAPLIDIALDPIVPDAKNGWYKTNPVITLSVTDANPYLAQYQWGGVEGEWLTYEGPFSMGSEGYSQLYYRAIDKSGKISQVKELEIKWDQTDLTNAPQNISVSPNPTSSDKSIVTWDPSSDNIGIDRYEVQWKLGDKVYTDSVGESVRKHELNNLTEGEWTVIVRAFDLAGNSKEGSVTLTVDRTPPAAPSLLLSGTTDGTASLNWGSVAGANSYVIWYGTTPGNYLYGANVGNTTSYTVSGLGAGTYYFVVKAHDASGNGSVNSNEVSTGAIAGAPGIVPGAPAAGFVEDPQVLGDQTESPEIVSLNTGNGSVLGDAVSRWWYWLLPLFLIVIYLIYRRYRKTRS